MTPFKYQSEIQDLPNCPPVDYRQVHLQAFRWVFEDDHHPNNFRPPLVISPRRRKDKRFHGNDRMTCAGYALSLFTTLEQAKKRYSFFSVNSPDHFPKSVGTHIAQGLITEPDGVASKADNSGHFELHEFAETALKPKFQWLGPAIQEKKYDGNN
jgi:hypothetical protein